MRILIYELITAGGLGEKVPASLRQEGAAMLRAVVQDFERIPGVEVLTLIETRLPSIGRCCRSVGSAEEAQAFRALAGDADAALIIAPEFDDLLPRRSQEALGAGCALLGSHPEAARLAGDKLRLADVFEGCGIATPRTRFVDAVVADKSHFPCVLKPRHGAGSQATYFISQRGAWSRSLRQARAEMPHADFIVQAFHPGLAVSVACLVGPAQIIVSPGATQCLSGDGRFRYLGGRTPLPRNLRERAVTLATRALGCVNGLRGYVGVDLVLGAAADGSEDVVIEINPRLTTSYIGWRCLTKESLAELWLKVWRGERATLPKWDGNEVDFYPDGRTSLALSRSL
jgi:tyramine---L-glutamate ligase